MIHSFADGDKTGNEVRKTQKKLYYGWVVLGTCLILLTTSYAIRLSFGVFFKSLEQDFGWTRTLTSSVFSLYMLSCSFFAVLGGWAADKHGGRIVFITMGIASFIGLALTSRVTTLWHMYLSYGLLVAMGTGATYTVAASLASRWFEQRRALAVAIVTSGVGLGSIVMAPVVSFFIAHHGWRTSYIDIGAISLVIFVIGALLLKPNPRRVTAPNDIGKSGSFQGTASQSEGSSLKQAVKTKTFALFMGLWFFYAFCLFTVMTHIVRHAMDLGIAALQAASVVAISGFANIPNRIAMGIVSDRYGARIAALISASLMAFSFLWLIQATQLWMLYVFAIAFGAAYGGLAPPTTAIVGDTFGIRNIGAILGVMEVAWVMGAAAGPAVAGYVFDTTGSYNIAFWLCMVSALIIVALLLPLQTRKAEKTG